MEKSVTEVLNEDRKNNDSLVGLLDESGPIKYLNMTADDFNEMAAEELLNAAAALNALSFQIQRFQSDNEAAANRLERYIEKKASLTASSYQGYSWDERKYKAINGSEELVKLDAEFSRLKQKSQQHKYLATSINSLAETLKKKADLKIKRLTYSN